MANQYSADVPKGFNVPKQVRLDSITGIQNEFFVSAEILSKTIDKEITSDTNQLLVFLKTKDHQQITEKTDENPFLIKDGTIKAKA